VVAVFDYPVHLEVLAVACDLQLVLVLVQQPVHVLR
jgi:hypothetical protein